MHPGLLQPLRVPEGKFQDLSLNFIMDFTLSLGSNSLLVIVHWLTKFITLLPCTFDPDLHFGAGGTADLLVHHIVCKYGISQSILHDQDSQFTVDLW